MVKMKGNKVLGKSKDWLFHCKWSTSYNYVENLYDYNNETEVESSL